MIYTKEMSHVICLFNLKHYEYAHYTMMKERNETPQYDRTLQKRIIFQVLWKDNSFMCCAAMLNL